jgi:hypothetical protein
MRVSGSFIYSVDGTPPTTQKIILNSTPTGAKTRYALNGTGTYVDMVTGDNAPLGPATGDVRFGVSYGGGQVGSCHVPPAASVAYGVPVDNTTGTAALDTAAIAAAVWGAAARTITGGTVDTLVNAPTVPSAEAIADEVRVELSAELASVAAIKAKTDALNTDRLAQCATVETTGGQLAAALS